MKILIADDHECVRDGLRLELQPLSDNVEFIDARNHAEVLSAAQRDAPLDLIVLDLYMPGGDGFELLTRLCERRPDVPVVVISASEDPQAMRKAIDIGAAGYIPKSLARRSILSAIQLVLSGSVYIPEKLFRSEFAGQSGPAPRADNSTPEEPLELTDRQVEVLELIRRGLSNKAIANTLGISSNTAKVHVATILKALRVDNRTAAAIAAEKLGLCARPDDGQK